MTMNRENCGCEFQKQNVIPKGHTGTRSNAIINLTLHTALPNTKLRIVFPRLASNSVVVPNSVKLLFNLVLTSNDPNRLVVDNISRNLIDTMTVKLDNREVTFIHNYDIVYSYLDKWANYTDRLENILEGIIMPNGNTLEAMKHRLNAADKNNEVSAKALGRKYKNRFAIPLDFEILKSPYYPNGYTSELSFELHLNKPEKVLIASKQTDSDGTETAPTGTYTLTNLRLNYEIIESSYLASLKATSLAKKVIYFNRITLNSFHSLDNTATNWNFNFNTPAKSLKGMLFIWKKPQTDFDYKVGEYTDPLITNTKIIINGIPNQLYPDGIKEFQQYAEAQKFLGDLHGINNKMLRENGIKPARLCRDGFCVWLDTRSSSDNTLHGSGLRLENGLDVVNVQMTKEAGTGKLECYIYQIVDAQINIENGNFKEVLY